MCCSTARKVICGTISDDVFHLAFYINLKKSHVIDDHQMNAPEILHSIVFQPINNANSLKNHKSKIPATFWLQIVQWKKIYFLIRAFFNDDDGLVVIDEMIFRVRWTRKSIRSECSVFPSGVLLINGLGLHLITTSKTLSI